MYWIRGPVRRVPKILSLRVHHHPNGPKRSAGGYGVLTADGGRAAGELLARGVGAVAIKLGAQGAYWLDGQASGMVPPFAVQAVDTVAAGDAFNGALAVALSEGHPLDSAVRWGCAAGALSVTRVGAQDSMPERDAVLALLEQSA